MAKNSFLLKGWTITLVAALFAFFLKGGSQGYVFVVFFPVAVFWVLDGYFLSQERLFRALYDHVRKLNEPEVDFSMNTNDYRKNKRNGWTCSVFSSTLLLFYLPMVMIMIPIAIWIN
ncbi:MAG: hypothetical protein OXL40_10135 [Bacteroidota bacterium]|nr:hypothetical protein [Bacteroidota bacterium]